MKKAFLSITLLFALFVKAQEEIRINSSDNQTITDISLSGNNLSLTIERGNTAVVDLTPIVGGGGGSDDQTITDFSLSGNIVSITIENGNTVNLDLTPLFVSNAPDGSETNLTAGTNITVTGSGTSGDPYIINSTGGGSGTDDQDATEVNLNPAIDVDGDTVNETTVQEAIQDGAVFVAGLVVDSTPILETSSRTLSILDLNRVLEYRTDGSNIELTWPDNFGNPGDVIHLVQFGTGQIRPIWSDAADVAITHETDTPYEHLIYRCGTNNIWYADPSLGVAYVPSSPTELYITANALSTTNEANATLNIGRAATSISDPTSVTNIVDNGTYSIRFDLVTTSSTSFGTVELPLDGNGTYDLSFRIYSTDAGQRIRSIINSDVGEVLLTQTADTWETVNQTFVVTNGASTATLEIGRGSAGETFYLDTFSLTKQ